MSKKNFDENYNKLRHMVDDKRRFDINSNYKIGKQALDIINNKFKKNNTLQNAHNNTFCVGNDDGTPIFY